MTITVETRPNDYAVGMSNHTCEITDEMRAVMEANSLALAEDMVTRKSPDSNSPSQSEG